MKYVYNDGGRAATGFKGKAGDCVVRAISIATEKPYREVYDAINHISREEPAHGFFGTRRSSSRNGVYKSTIYKYMKSLGWKWTPTMGIGSGCRVHLDSAQLPTGKLVVKVSKHMVAVIDGVIHDTFDPSRDGSRCVYGYWSKL